MTTVDALPAVATRDSGTGRFRVVLACGQSVWFRVAQHLPRCGDAMPCPRHDYCVVTRTHRTGVGHVGTGTRQVRRRRRNPRIEDLLVVLDARPGTTTFGALLRAGFTLRLLRALELAGGAAVDWTAGHCTSLRLTDSERTS